MEKEKDIDTRGLRTALSAVGKAIGKAVGSHTHDGYLAKDDLAGAMDELFIAEDSQWLFGGKLYYTDLQGGSVKAAGDVSVNGDLSVNSTVTASDIEAADTLTAENVNVNNTLCCKIVRVDNHVTAQDVKATDSAHVGNSVYFYGVEAGLGGGLEDGKENAAFAISCEDPSGLRLVSPQGVGSGDGYIVTDTMLMDARQWRNSLILHSDTKADGREVYHQYSNDIPLKNLKPGDEIVYLDGHHIISDTTLDRNGKVEIYFWIMNVLHRLAYDGEYYVIKHLSASGAWLDVYESDVDYEEEAPAP